MKHFQDVLLLKDFVPDENTFYYVLGYNPETKRLATTQGEIRVGSSHQVRFHCHPINYRLRHWRV